MNLFTIATISFTVVTLTTALDNGLALTPPMGWLAWERFRCNTDCEKDPDNCISENLFKQMADRMSSADYKDAGYEYLCMDGCWLAGNRTSDGILQPDPNRFPSGIKALADYVHSKGLKFGIYEDFGRLTCGNNPGSEFYLEEDALTFAQWGVDLLKFDGCYSVPSDMDYGYPAMSLFLNKTGRPILFSCEWPLYQQTNHIEPNYTAIRRSCNMWRNYYDIQDSWDSLSNVINYYMANDGDFLSFAGPGGWNDPDMLIIGNFGLSLTQERVQMAMWAMFAAPLLMSNDLRNLRNESKALLLNRRVIAINQDPLGVAARNSMSLGCVDVWTRPIQPDGSKAIAFVHMNTSHKYSLPARINIRAQDLGLDDSRGYDVVETFDGTEMGRFNPGDTIGPLIIDPTGVFLITATPARTHLKDSIVHS